MQGGLVSLTLLNVVVENVIRNWMAMIIEDQRVDHDGLGETIGLCLVFLYADDGMIGSRDSDWLQSAINVLVGIFRRYGLSANIAKSCTMTCQIGALRTGVLEEDMELKLLIRQFCRKINLIVKHDFIRIMSMYYMLADQGG